MASLLPRYQDGGSEEKWMSRRKMMRQLNPIIDMS